MAIFKTLVRFFRPFSDGFAAYVAIGFSDPLVRSLRTPTLAGQVYVGKIGTSPRVDVDGQRHGANRSLKRLLLGPKFHDECIGRVFLLENLLIYEISQSKNDTYL